MIGKGLIVDVPAGTLVTRRGFRERESYFVLDGRFESGERFTAKGGLFGEDAFLEPDGRRRSSVRALDDGRVLILRGRSVEKLLRRDPALEAPVMTWLHDNLASRPAIASAA